MNHFGRGLIATGILAAAASPVQADRRIVVAALDKDGHMSYAFRGDEPLLHVEVNRPKLPARITISNETGGEVKVHLYNGSDAVRAIAKRSAVLKSGKSVRWPYQLYHLKVFRTGFLDKLVLTKLNLGGDVALTKKKGGYAAVPAKIPTFQIGNGTKETIRAMIYNEGDSVRMIARKSFTIEPERYVTWSNPPNEEFRVRIHRAKFLGEVLSDARRVNVRSRISVSAREWSPWKKLYLTQWTNGTGRSTDVPKVFPAVDGFSANVEGHSMGDVNKFPQLYGLAADGGFWIQTLRDIPVQDATSQVHGSTDWELSDQVGDLKTHFLEQVASTPSVVSDGDTERTGKDKVIFAQGKNGDLVTKRMYLEGSTNFNTAGNWDHLGGKLDSRPVAVAVGGGRPSRLLVAIRDAETQALKVRFREKNKLWGPWTDLGGSLKGSPSATAAHFGTGALGSLPSRLDIFARGHDNTLMHRAWLEGESWQAWKNLGGNLASDPAVFAESDPNPWPLKKTVKTRYHVFALGPAGDVVYRHYDGSSWGSWKSLGGKFASAPVVFLSDDQR